MDNIIRSKAEQWFCYAENDLQAAKKLFGEINHITCFHCQQSAEKYLKGLLVLFDKEFRKSHDLSYLVDLLKCNVSEEIMSAAEFLTAYSVEARYPGDFPVISNQEAQDALQYAEEIKTFVLKAAVRGEKAEDTESLRSC